MLDKAVKELDSITKNKPSPETIAQMTTKAFGENIHPEIKELTEGCFNAAYLVTLPDGRETVLKIAPPPETRILSYEKNIMYAEVECMRMVKEKTQILVPNILYYDDSHTVCPSNYFFMQKLDGQSFSQISDSLTEEFRNTLQYHMGQLNAEINRIHGKRFGYFAQPEKQGNSWFPIFSEILNDILLDADSIHADIRINPDKIRKLLTEDKEAFDEVSTPCLVHWDLWEGNVFVKDGKITGLIDFERCLWADPLMEFGFRSFEQNPAFLKGYGSETMTKAESIRSHWYDFYLFLINVTEADFRQYTDDRLAEWAKGKLQETLNWLENNRTM